MHAVDIFISYRRTQAFLAGLIHERLCSIFRSDRVFLDSADIAPGAQFPDEIRNHLSSSRVVLALIDPTWISVQDPRSMRRRLDIKSDWVRIELETALHDGKIVIPVLLDGASIPKPEQLPARLKELASRQGMTVNQNTFADDVGELIAAIRAQLSGRELQEFIDDDSLYPIPGPFKPVPVEGELLESMMRQLPHWRVAESRVENHSGGTEPSVRTEIVRDFRFESFLDAVSFMHAAARPIDAFGHHPRWENIFQTVRVALSTWDIGHRPSDRDFKTAIMLERQYQRFVGAQTTTGQASQPDPVK